MKIKGQKAENHDFNVYNFSVFCVANFRKVGGNKHDSNPRIINRI